MDQSGRIEMDHKVEGNANQYKRVVDFTGQTMDRDVEGYLKWGIYKPVWKYSPDSSKVSVRTVWHDNVAVGSSWEAVDPSVSEKRRLKQSPTAESPLPIEHVLLQSGARSRVFLI